MTTTCDIRALVSTSLQRCNKPPRADCAAFVKLLLASALLALNYISILIVFNN